jgi:ferrous iron transport protein A
MSETLSCEIRSLDQIPKGAFVEVVEVVALVEVVNTDRVVGMSGPAGGNAPGEDPIARRLGDLGVRQGVRIEVIRRAPLGDPTVYELCNYQLCLRRTESARIRVRLLAPSPGAHNTSNTSNAPTDASVPASECARR